MRILLIYPNITSQEGISPGLAYLSGSLKDAGHTVKLFDFTWEKNVRKCIDLVKSYRPGLIGFTSTAMDYGFAKDAAARIREHSKALIVFGGPHATTAPDEILKEAAVDMVCVGECEYALVELAGKLERKVNIDDVQNVHSKRNGSIIRNPPRPLLQDLDSLRCDRDIYDFAKYIKARGGVLDVYAGRGCPYRCNYCINHVLQDMYRGQRYVRMRSVNGIIDEIKVLRKKYDVRSISFPDDTFTFNRDWVKDFCRAYKREIDLPFIINGRVENVDDRMAKALKDGHCVSVLFGVESGSDRIRREVLNRHVSDKQIISAFKACRKLGIKTFSFNMVGIPHETKADIQKTIRLNQRLMPDEVQVTIFYPFPGTELQKVCEAEGLIGEGTLKDYSEGSIMRYKDISRKELKRIRDMFAFHVFWAYDKPKAIRSLLIGKSYNLYLALRGSTPPALRRLAQKIANTFFFRR
jgi:anaerobic magnesium-protoporphyrin IX monomethyl ester cyclase